MSPDNLSSKDSTESKILDLLEILPPLGAAALCTLVGYQLHPVLPEVSSLIWVVLWMGAALMYAGFRSAPRRAKGCLLIFAALGGVVLHGSPVEVKLAWTGLVFAGWLGVVVVLFSVRYRTLMAAAWAAGLIAWGYILGWVYLLIQDPPGRIWLIWSLTGGFLFAFWIAGSLKVYFREVNSPAFSAAGDLYLLSFNLFLVSVFSVHFLFDLLKSAQGG